MIILDNIALISVVFLIAVFIVVFALYEKRPYPQRK